MRADGRRSTMAGHALVLVLDEEANAAWTYSPQAVVDLSREVSAKMKLETACATGGEQQLFGRR